MPSESSAAASGPQQPVLVQPQPQPSLAFARDRDPAAGEGQLDRLVEGGGVAGLADRLQRGGARRTPSGLITGVLVPIWLPRRAPPLSVRVEGVDTASRDRMPHSALPAGGAARRTCRRSSRMLADGAIGTGRKAGRRRLLRGVPARSRPTRRNRLLVGRGGRAHRRDPVAELDPAEAEPQRPAWCGPADRGRPRRAGQPGQGSGPAEIDAGRPPGQSARPCGLRRPAAAAPGTG